MGDKDKEAIRKESAVLHSANLVQDIFRDNCTCCPPSEWKDKYEQEYFARVDGKETILLLFDENLLNGRSGIQFAQNALSVPNCKNYTFCGIISQGFSIDGEFAKRKEYKANDSKSYIYPLSKGRLDDNDTFVEGIKNILWVKHIESLNAETTELFKKAFDETLKQYNEIFPSTYKQIIIDSSEEEGARELDTILRLVQVILDKKIRIEISNNEVSVLNKYCEKILEINTINEEAKKSDCNQQAKDFNNDETFIEGKILNGLYTPLRNGDIFKIGKTFRILICPPCNISIRKTGARGNDYDTAFLVELRKAPGGMKNNEATQIFSKIKGLLPGDNETIDQYEEYIQRIIAEENAMNLSLKAEIDNKKYFITLNHFKATTFSLLDLVVFNKEGKAIIRLDDTNNDGLHRNQIKRKKKLISELNDWQKLDQEMHGLCPGCTDKMDQYRNKIIPSCLNILRIKPTITGNSIEIPIQRIGHLRNPYSDEVLIQFSHYLSRAGFPNPFV